MSVVKYYVGVKMMCTLYPHKWLLISCLYLVMSMQPVLAADLYDNVDIDRRVAVYEYVDPSGKSRSVDEISETAFIHEFIAEKYPAYETDIDEKISDNSGNHMALACLEGELYTKNVIWNRHQVGEWRATVLVTQRCYQKWYTPGKDKAPPKFAYQVEHGSKTVRTPFTFTIKFKECRSGNLAYAAENCDKNTGYSRNVR